MAATEWFRAIEEDSAALKRIADAYDESSPEYRALSRAALAFAYVMMEHSEEFARFTEQVASGLTDTQREHLRSMGINIDPVK